MPSVVPRPAGAGVPAGGGAADEIERFVREAVAGLAPDPAEPVTTGPGRPRVLPALALWAGLLAGVLRGLGGQRGVWRLLSLHGLRAYPRFPVTGQAARKRRAGGGTGVMVALFRRVSAALADRLAPFADATPAPFAAEVVALDGTTPDPPARRLPAPRGLPAAARLPGKVAGRLDPRRQQWQHVRHIEDARARDKVAARDLLAGLPPGSLVLADLGYFAFAWFDDLAAAGHHHASRLRAGTSYVITHAFYRDGGTLDAPIRPGAHRADRAGRAPRLVRFRAGPPLYRHITDLLDPQTPPLYEVARLYARRWGFEPAVKPVKRHLGLRPLWSATPAVVQQQAWAGPTIAQILRAPHLAVAARAGLDPLEVSLPLLVASFPRRARGPRPGGRPRGGRARGRLPPPLPAHARPGTRHPPRGAGAAPARHPAGPRAAPRPARPWPPRPAPPPVAASVHD